MTCGVFISAHQPARGQTPICGENLPLQVFEVFGGSSFTNFYLSVFFISRLLLPSFSICLENIQICIVLSCSWSESLHTVWRDSEEFTPSWRSSHVQRASAPWRWLNVCRILSYCRWIYSGQSKSFICVLVDISQELLSLCGADLSSALPWLELHTLNFSYNSIVCLDQSLVRKQPQMHHYWPMSWASPHFNLLFLP